MNGLHYPAIQMCEESVKNGEISFPLSLSEGEKLIRRRSWGSTFCSNPTTYNNTCAHRCSHYSHIILRTVHDAPSYIRTCCTQGGTQKLVYYSTYNWRISKNYSKQQRESQQDYNVLDVSGKSDVLAHRKDHDLRRSSGSVARRKCCIVHFCKRLIRYICTNHISV